MTSKAQQSITFVGIGAIGYVMARRLAHHGYAVAAVDPSAAARDLAVAEGMTAYPDISVAPPSDIVLVIVATGQQLLDVVKSGTAGVSVEGQTWVFSSTVGPDAVKEAAGILLEAGAAAVDAPVTGGLPGADSGTLRFLTAGPAHAVDNVGDVLSVLGDITVISERPGDGQATKLVNQLCSTVHIVAAAEAIALSVQLGLDPKRTVDIIAGGSGASWYFDERGPRMAQIDAAPEMLTRLAILAKDNLLVEAIADQHGANVPLLKTAKQQYLKAKELGLLEADDSQIIRTYLD